jgi:hypothetical protein
MHLYRSDPEALQHEAVLQSHKASAEEVLHPPERTPTFADPFAIGRARASGDLRAIDKTVLAPYGLALDPSMGALAGRIKQSPRLYRALRPPALAVLQALGAATRAISGGQPLIVTSTVRDKDYQRVLAATDQEATHAYSLHTTGYAFDIARVYRSRAQALAFQWVLDRLAARGMIAWIREPQAIHITVASR